eukprot:TRINITY_DN11955_c0_g1_i1.p1 TRINITY_DN11955_c0_g1~~TRINITY_DN11955_c0_g1_i1.p1  ORF type:complete len:1176 (+),score=264.58 TRINITY_DN11955_c0_g1_i1:313-3840(+)
MASRAQSLKDLLEEAKKRAVALFVCIIGLSYLMSLTSSSVLINIPAAIMVILVFRFLSIEAKNQFNSRKAATSTSRRVTEKKLPLGDASDSSPRVSDWRRKVDSPSVEAAMDKLSRHLVSEWITGLWYGKITPDRDAPEELAIIINGVLGEICVRAKDVNLIDLLTRDVVNLLCENILLYRLMQTQIGEDSLNSLTFVERDAKLKSVLATNKKLHPALVSPEAEHKVLQQLMDGVLKLTCRSEDLQCKFFHYVARELLACTVIRPVINLASPKFVNERIEVAVLSLRNRENKLIKSSESEKNLTKITRSRDPTDHFSGFPDRSFSGVELVRLGSGDARKSMAEETYSTQNPPLRNQTNERESHLALSTGGQRANSTLPSYQQHVDISCDKGQTYEVKERNNVDRKAIQRPRPAGGDWAHMLDIMSRRKTQALAPEHYDNMWSKGRNYKKKEDSSSLPKIISSKASQEMLNNSVIGRLTNCSKLDGFNSKLETTNRVGGHAQPVVVNKSMSSNVISDSSSHVMWSTNADATVSGKATSQREQRLHSVQDKMELEEALVQPLENIEEDESSYTSEDDESGNVTGLDTPGVKVWDSKNSRKGLSHVHHPLENVESNQAAHRKKGQLRHRKLYKTLSGRKRTRANQGTTNWQELERKSFFLGDGLDILNASKKEDIQPEDLDKFSDNEARVSSGALACSSVPSQTSVATKLSESNLEIHQLASKLSNQYLRCKVLGANIAKSGCKTIAVYSISVTDHSNNSWSIKRRFRHFEELHHRLKEFPEYCLTLPPKRILSSSLDSSVVYERCKLLDRYLKELLSLPGVAESFEVWDFLTVDSQTYTFSNCLTIIETLSVDLEDKHEDKKATDKSLSLSDKKPAPKYLDSTILSSRESRWKGEDFNDLHLNFNKREKMRNNSGSDSDHGNVKLKAFEKISDGRMENRREEKRDLHQTLEEYTFTDDEPLPSEWVPPNLSVPILNLVDVLFQLQDGGWIRRQVFWVAKQVLQLGMGDAFDDWLIEKIQLLRKGEVIASAIARVEQILWPDGIFLTKHPRRQPPPSSACTVQSDLCSKTKEISKGSQTSEYLKVDSEIVLNQQTEESRRANFVRELMIDKAPAALVSLIGQREYKRCAEDIYFFLQSAVFLKQLAYGLLELLLLAAFPELSEVVNSSHSDQGDLGTV